MMVGLLRWALALALCLFCSVGQAAESFVKAGQAGAKHGVEGTGYGWKTDAVIGPKDIAPTVRCTMERPSR